MAAKGYVSAPSNDPSFPSLSYDDQIDRINDEIVDFAKRAPLFLVNISGDGDNVVAETKYATNDPPGLATLDQEHCFWYSPEFENTGAVVFEIDDCSAVDAKANDGSVLPAGYFKVGSLYLLIFDGTNLISADIGSSFIAGNRAPDCVLEEQKNAGIAAGNSTSNTATNRVLNTVVRDGADVSLDVTTGIFTVGAGAKMIEWSAPQYGAGLFISELYNVTDAVSVKSGTAMQSGTADQVHSQGCAFVDFATSKELVIRTKPASTTTDGLGKPSNQGLTEVYSRVAVTNIDETDDDFEGTPGGAINELYEYDTIDNTESDPGQAKFKTDDADLALTEEIYLSGVSGDALEDISEILNSLAAGSSSIKATLTVHADGDRRQYVRYTIASITDNTGWFTLAVDYKDGSINALDDGDGVRFVFDRSGDAGTTAKAYASPVTPTVLSGNVDDWDVGTSARDILRVATDGSGNYVINGLVKKRTGEVIDIFNVGTNGKTVSLGNEAGTSTAANRIDTGISGPVVLSSGESVSIWYDETASRWKIRAIATATEKAIAGKQARTPIGDANYDILPTDRIVALTVAFTANRTHTLPLAASVTPGTSVEISDEIGTVGVSGRRLRVETSGSDTLSISNFLNIYRRYVRITFTSDGVSKWIYDSVAVANFEAGINVNDTTGAGFEATFNVPVSANDGAEVSGTAQFHGLIDISDPFALGSAGQIKFPAAQNPSSNANTLDDYEEGAYTPTVSFVTPGTSSFSYSTRLGSYTKIGNRVFVDINLDFTPTIGTGAGGFRISLPFTSDATYEQTGVVSQMNNQWTWAAGRTYVAAAAVGNQIVLRQVGSAVLPAQVTNSHMTSGQSHTINVSICFKV